jgi:ABC-type transport system involved in cytochrome c biogenesis ATPase subunit
MAAFTVPLKANVLFPEPQILEFEKITTFIGGNGSGKSTILKLIFDEKLNGLAYQNYKIVCFSSGQNENYSSSFSSYLTSERSKKNALSLDCFYYDKLWAKLLIFLATTSKSNGLVRTFLKQHNYVLENKFDGDGTTTLFVDVKVDQGYVNRVKQAREDEVNGETDLIINRAYHLTLTNFINALIDKNYDFNKPLEQRSIELSQFVLTQVSFEDDEDTVFDSKVMFFTQAADNDYFFVKESFDLTFKSGDRDLRLEDMSDGEYQLLFIYSLFDLFDTDRTLFLLDEADSHLHYKNIDRLWDVFDHAKGGVITTTHLIDSIAKSGIDRLKIIENGQAKSGKELKNLSMHLRDLTAIKKLEFQALTLFSNIVMMDGDSDWVLFKLLVIRKLANSIQEKQSIENKFNSFIAITCSSSWEKIHEKFGFKKIQWLESFADYIYGHPHEVRNIFLICDKDELPLNNIGTAKCELLLQGKIDGGKEKSDSFSRHLLSWKRREIKHYLLSYTAMSHDVDNIECKLNLGPQSKLRPGDSGDRTTNGEDNRQLADVSSKTVKEIVDPYINIDGVGFSVEKARDYIARIPREEISDDIENMYNYLVENK